MDKRTRIAQRDARARITELATEAVARAYANSLMKPADVALFVISALKAEFRIQRKSQAHSTN